jgi:Ca2+/Na+ antiporter
MNTNSLVKTLIFFVIMFVFFLVIDGFSMWQRAAGAAAVSSVALFALGGFRQKKKDEPKDAREP